jgi:FMN phosphatase YigB (HAD superfamily)
LTLQHIFFDWGGTLMHETGGPHDVPMALWPQVQTLPHAREVLQTLHHKIPLSICTNASVSGRAMVEQALSRVGLLHLFSHIFCYTDLGYRKDQPEFWNAVFATVHAPREQTLMVGDNLQQDVLAPQQFGLQSIWFNWMNAPAAAGVATIHDLRELLVFIDKTGH